MLPGTQTSTYHLLYGPPLPTSETLDETLAEQQQIIARQRQIIAEQQKRIALLEEQIRLQRAKRFGRSSEQSSQQLSLFDEPEAVDEAPIITPAYSTVNRPPIPEQIGH